MKVTKSHKNIEKAMRLNALLRKAERLAQEIKPLRAHFRELIELLDPDEKVVVAGRLAIVGTKVTRSSFDREGARPLIAPEQFAALIKDTSYVDIDVKPAMQLARGVAGK